MNKHDESLSYADYWLRDGLKICEAPGFFGSVEVDMTASENLISDLRSTGIKITYTHLFVKAAAVTLTRCPELHQLVIRKHRIYPEIVDIGLSISGQSFVAPIMVIKDAANKNINELAEEIMRRTPEIRHQDEKLLKSLQKWGWIIPFGWLRRAILRSLMAQAWFRLSGTGTFQVSCLPNVDMFVPFLFNTSAILGVGRVRERVVVIDHQPTVRPTVILSCCADHKVWDGVSAAKFLTELAKILESGELEREIGSNINNS